MTVSRIESDESVFSVCYTSAESKPHDRKSINKLVNHANQFNSGNGITGVLCYNNGVFFQYLEGKEHDVKALMTRIKSDRRHRVTSVFDFPELRFRRFLDWSLLHVNTDIYDVAANVDSIHKLCDQESRTINLSDSIRSELFNLIDNLGNDPFQNNIETDAGKRIIAIGASAGGIDPIKVLLSTLPNKLSASILVVLHLSPNHDTVLDEILERETGLTVKLAQNDDLLQPGVVYLIPPNKNLEVISDRIRISDQCRATATLNVTRLHKIPFPIDILFENLAKEYGNKVIGVLLSGSGNDGTIGAIRLQEEGAIVLAQDPNTADFDSMPNAAITANAVNRILRPEQMAEAISSIVNSHSFHAAFPLSEHEFRHTENILSLLSQHGVNFSGYRRRTIINRLRRRRTLLELQNLDEYFELVSNSLEEREELQSDLLIRVTDFFRDNHAWKNLKNIIETKLLPSLAEDEHTLRVWIPGCSTGEEPYSLAMLLSDIIETSDLAIDFKIFASDLNDVCLEQTTRGVYKSALVKAIPEKYLSRYFTKIGDDYHISSTLKERVIAVKHNLIEDAPFTNMHLSCCRNLMIYLDKNLQTHSLKALHFSLVKDGVLFIGPSETLSSLAPEFDIADRQWNIFIKHSDKKLPLNISPGFLEKHKNQKQKVNRSKFKKQENNEVIYKNALELYCHDQLKTALIINSNTSVEIVVADPNGLLAVGSGQPSSKIEQLIVNSLVETVIVHLQQLDKLEKKHIRSSNISCINNRGENVTVDIEITEMKSDAMELYWIVTFQNSERIDSTVKDQSPPIDVTQGNQVSRESTEELRRTLFETIQELDHSNHEQQDAMEQLTTANEELQSTNEELQSVNEELYTVNFEYQSKIHELSDLTNDMNNLMQYTDLGVIFIDLNLCIRRYTDQAAKITHLSPRDIDRPVEIIEKQISYPKLQEDVSRVVSLGKPIVKDINYMECNGRLHIGIYPYKVDSDFTQGAIITMMDLADLSSFTVDPHTPKTSVKANDRNQEADQPA